MDTVVHGALKISTDRQDDRVRLEFAGGCDFKRPEDILTPLFSDLIVQNYREIIISFDKLEFMNSAMIPPIVRFIQKIDEKKRTTVITYDGELKWQVNSFKQLKNFVKAKEIHSVVVRPG